MMFRSDLYAPCPCVSSCRARLETGYTTLDSILHGGLPLSGTTEIFGSRSSGRTTLAVAYLAEPTREGRVCAWIDVTGDSPRRRLEPTALTSTTSFGSVASARLMPALPKPLSTFIDEKYGISATR